ncbi:MAG: phosphatidate cytidylyltransferase, partial [Thermoanaerobaculia bacterium]
SSLALMEFYGLIQAAGWIAPRWVGMAILLALLAGAYLRETGTLLALVGICLVTLPTLVMFASPPESTLLPSSAASVFATLYVALGAGAVIGLRTFGWRPILFLLLTVWVGDSAAYYVGRRWGKKKLAPVVSPKKTWAGLVGQMIGGTVLGLLFGVLMRAGLVQILALGVLGAVISGVAVIGDLVESTFKRSSGVKDSGGLLPGHGGLLDRLDSLLYAAPVLLLIGSYLPQALPR